MCGSVSHPAWRLLKSNAIMQIMFQQLRPGNSYARISWQDLFTAMKIYCERFSPGPEQQVSVPKPTHQIPC